MLFTARSLLTMLHGIVLGGAAMMALSAVLFALYAGRTASPDPSTATSSRAVSRLMGLTAVVLWLTVIAGTYVIFPPYRAAPPDGVADLSHYPRALLHASPDTVWLHAFAMESKEHMPWIASMLATAVAFVAARCRSRMITDSHLRRMASTLVAICLALVGFSSLMGIFVNKVAPLW